MIMSILPPAKPAISPTGTPTPDAMVTEITPASRLARAPQITRLSTSRPFSSVPIQCAQDGAFLISVQLVWVGSNGATQGASRATMTKSVMMTNPPTAAGRRKKRRTARRAGDCMARAMTAPASLAAVALMMCEASG
jgi:hypothetical protein